MRPAAFSQAADGAPLFFGTDLRMRNFVALAVNGPLWESELRLINDIAYIRTETKGDAPFGRADTVRIWEQNGRTALALDPAHPLHPPLLDFLLALARSYPPRVIELGPERPEMPAPEPWVGDRYVVFGHRMHTMTLYTLADRHWTFESLVWNLMGGYRETVKVAVHRLEEQGMLAGSRRRGPGFGPRLLRLADECPGREELQALIDAVPITWPDIGESLVKAFNDVPEKTKVYFRNRGLL